MRSLKAALGFLTFSPWSQKAPASAEELGRSTPFFPLVGLFLGSILALLDRLFGPYLTSEVWAVLLVALLIIMSRGVHLVDLGRLFDRWGKSGVAEGGEGPESGGATVLAVAAIIITLVLKVSSVEVLGEFSTPSLILAPVLSRWAMVLSAYGSDWIDEGMERALSGQVRGWQLFWATAASVVLAVAIGGRVGLWTALWLSLFTLGCKAALRRRLGGLPRGSLGAAVELNEALALALFASLY